MMPPPKPNTATLGVSFISAFMSFGTNVTLTNIADTDMVDYRGMVFSGDSFYMFPMYNPGINKVVRIRFAGTEVVEVRGYDIPGTSVYARATIGVTANGNVFSACAATAGTLNVLIVKPDSGTVEEVTYPSIAARHVTAMYLSPASGNPVFVVFSGSAGTFTDPRLVEVDTTTGAWVSTTPITSLPAQTTLNVVMRHPVSGVVYAVSANTIYSLDTVSGDVTPIVPVGYFVNTGVVVPNGNIFFSVSNPLNTNSPRVLVFNPTDNTVVELSSIIMSNPGTFQCYAMALSYDGWVFLITGGDKLTWINPTTHEVKNLSVGFMFNAFGGAQGPDGYVYFSSYAADGDPGCVKVGFAQPSIPGSAWCSLPELGQMS